MARLTATDNGSRHAINHYSDRIVSPELAVRNVIHSP